MRVPCLCGVYRLNPENATYVREGVPLCHAATCQKVAEHRHVARVPEPSYAARDVPVGTSWAFTEHRTMGEIMRQEGFDATA